MEYVHNAQQINPLLAFVEQVKLVRPIKSLLLALSVETDKSMDQKLAIAR